MKKILIVGVARSGSSWVSRIVNYGLNNSVYVHEPDSHFVYCSASFAKYNCGLFPKCTNNQLTTLWRSVYNLEEYSYTRVDRLKQRIWKYVPGLWKDHSVYYNKKTVRGFITSRISKGARVERLEQADSTCIVAKSVHAVFYVEDIVKAVCPDAVIVTIRPLEEIIASWLSMNYWPFEIEEQPNAFDILSAFLNPPESSWPRDEVRSVVWSVVVMQLSLLAAAKKMNWTILDHASACKDTNAAFRELFQEINLEFSQAVADEIARTNKPSQNEYDTSRLTSTERGKWRGRLSPETAQKVESELADLGIRCR